MRMETWPSLPLEVWKETYATLHLWLQIVGKIKLKLCPFVNHWWEVALYPSPQGLRTSLIPYGPVLFEIEFDFVNHRLIVTTNEGQRRSMMLKSQSVASFYRELMGILRSLDLRFQIDLEPKELPLPVTPFDQDENHRCYDVKYAHRFWWILMQISRVFEEFRACYYGKSSPVHFWWGSFDLAVSRFSGRPSTPPPTGDHITRVGYSHEVMSCGFWPGSGNIQECAFYSYIFPEPSGFAKSTIMPAAAYYNSMTKGFILPYEAVRSSADPHKEILAFCQSSYSAAADLAQWDEKLQRRSATSETLRWI